MLYAHLTLRIQVALVAVFLLFGGWAAFTSVSFLFHEKVVAAKDGLIASARLSYSSLLEEVAGYQKKFMSISRDLEDDRDLMLGLVEENASLQKNLNTVSTQLKTTEHQREKVVARGESLKHELGSVESSLRSLSSRNLALKENVATVESDLQTALKERNKALFHGTRMNRRIKELEIRLTDLQDSEQQAVQRLMERTALHISNMERVIGVAGLDVNRLLKADRSRVRGQGGPFIAAKPDSLAASRLKAELTDLDNRLGHSEALQAVMARLPLAPPLIAYSVTSGFGKRRDPVNRKWASHYGLDLSSRYKTSVYAPAPGIVTHAGWKGKYGRLIEIDHGAGLKTRYGHLYKVSVKKGQKVKFRHKIGLLGSSGRSTGAHLHYEVIFRGKYLNPANFIKAGRHVFQN